MQTKQEKYFCKYLGALKKIVVGKLSQFQVVMISCSYLRT